METTELKMIKLSALVPSKTNPRKHFDDTALEELAASIKEKGVLQPIVVRPKGKTKYEVVCGERRYRASQLAEVETIPAVIRELHDDEALELQIVENLQRKDVHPMEEAAAFLNLVNFKMEVKEIALRVGKSPKYVSFRLKLNDLIPDFQQMFFQDRMTMNSAVMLARVSEDAQNMILKERCKSWKEREDFYLSDVQWYIGRVECDLSEAKFETEDTDLHPEAGACGSCQHNSANSPMLFEDKKGCICTNPVCFHIKEERAFKQNIEKVIADPETLIVNTSWESDTEKVRQVKELGVNVLDRKSFTKIEKPEHPGSWEDYLADHQDENDLSEEDIQDIKADYDSMLEQYQEEVQDYQDNISSGKIRKAFIVEGYNDAGKYIDVLLNEKGSALAGGTPDAAAEEIATIQGREARAKELDQEKIFKRVSEELKNYGDFLSSPGDLNEPECVALALMLHGFAGYNSSDAFLKSVGIERGQWGDYTKKSLFEEFSKKLTPAMLNQFIRRVLLDQLITGLEINPEKHGKAMAIMGIAEHYLPDRVKEIQLEQQEKAAKRAARVKQRIEALKKKEVEA